MLAAPNKKRRPLFAAKDIKAFYMNHAPKIFPQLRGPFGRMMRIFRSMSGPSYDGKHLHEVVREKLGSTRLHQTLTNVVIPTFDIKWLQPTIFSSYEVSLFPFILLPLKSLKSILCVVLDTSVYNS
jgi:patatin-like phospholipase/acyl hydrolase